VIAVSGNVPEPPRPKPNLVSPCRAAGVSVSPGATLVTAIPLVDRQPAPSLLPVLRSQQQDLTQLATWFDQALDAKTTEEIFGPP
jgi:hypothetical protein